MENKVIDITQYFSRNNEENGIWKELFLNGSMSGIEACIYGVNSNHINLANENYKKEIAEISQIKDIELKNSKTEIAFAKRLSGFVKDFRNKETKESLGKDGKQMTESEIYEVMFNSPIIARAVLEIATETELFLEKEKNA